MWIILKMVVNKLIGFLVIGVMALGSQLGWSASDASATFRAKVDELHGMTADFQQNIIDEDGLELGSYKGSFKLNSDSKSFYLQTTSPEETILCSNGKDIYYYEKELDQVTIYRMDKISRTSPFWVVIDRQSRDFDKYNITPVGENAYQLSPKEESKESNVYTLYFDSEGLGRVEMTDGSGQKVIYQLQNRKFIRTIPSVEFVFLMPNGVTVDDQR